MDYVSCFVFLGDLEPLLPAALLECGLERLVLHALSVRGSPCDQVSVLNSFGKNFPLCRGLYIRDSQGAFAPRPEVVEVLDLYVVPGRNHFTNDMRAREPPDCAFFACARPLVF